MARLAAALNLTSPPGACQRPARHLRVDASSVPGDSVHASWIRLDRQQPCRPPVGVAVPKAGAVRGYRHCALWMTRGGLRGLRTSARVGRMTWSRRASRAAIVRVAGLPDGWPRHYRVTGVTIRQVFGAVARNDYGGHDDNSGRDTSPDGLTNGAATCGRDISADHWILCLSGGQRVRQARSCGRAGGRPAGR